MDLWGCPNLADNIDYAFVVADVQTCAPPLVVEGGHIPERRVEPPRVVPTFDVLEITLRARARVGHAWPWMSSHLSVDRKLSQTALSQHWPGRDSDWRAPWRFNSPVNSADVSWEPRSEWKIRPGSGRRRSMAMLRAWHTSSARMWSAIAQPTIRREATSITVARYIHPSQVRT